MLIQFCVCYGNYAVRQIHIRHFQQTGFRQAHTAAIQQAEENRHYKMAIRNLKEDAARSEEAELHRRMGHEKEAIERWQVVFHDPFPTYG